MPAGFDEACPVAQLYGAFARVKEFVADFRANEKFYFSPACRVTKFYAASTARLTSWSMTFTPSPPPKSKSWGEITEHD